jgi:membrane-associated protease RseP (regulator of RpoE activity)
MTPDGPAMRAGLRGSDVITAIDHKPVEGKTVVEAVGNARAMLRDLKTGQNVTIDYLRDGKKGSVTFAAERREALNWPLVMGEDAEHPMLPKDFNERVQADVERSMRAAEARYERDHERMAKQMEKATREAMQRAPAFAHVPMPWWGLNLATLNADLGRYFGADKGVLVLAADEESLPGIRAGDVITSVAGETVTRPEDALRALRDQESGKDVPIKLLRDRKTLALNMKAPAFNSIFNLRIAPPAPPAPVVAPAPAPAPAPAAPAAPPAPPAPEPIASL